MNYTKFFMILLAAFLSSFSKIESMVLHYSLWVGIFCLTFDGEVPIQQVQVDNYKLLPICFVC